MELGQSISMQRRYSNSGSLSLLAWWQLALNMSSPKGKKRKRYFKSHRYACLHHPFTCCSIDICVSDYQTGIWVEFSVMRFAYGIWKYTKKGFVFKGIFERVTFCKILHQTFENFKLWCFISLFLYKVIFYCCEAISSFKHKRAMSHGSCQIVAS